jgi:RimJ/RimL family protein N-acetyltransferase
MFSLNGVTLRPLEPDDIDTLYAWELDAELDILAGWGIKESRVAHRQRYEKRIAEPADDLTMFGIEAEGHLIGYMQLAAIDVYERRADVGFLIGEKTAWGHGFGTTALRLWLDYAFTVRALERISAETYSFNTRSQRLLERVGFQREGGLLQYENHTGVRQDMHLFGLLKPEFYARYETIFKLPDESAQADERP